MSCKDSVGRIYIRAYRNRWDPEKKRSFVEARLQVGRLQQDGSVSLSDRFEETFPDYRGKQWFWADRELVSAEEFRAQFPVERQAKDISWSDESIRVGVTYAAWTLAEKLRFSVILSRFSANKMPASCLPWPSTNSTAVGQ